MSYNPKRLKDLTEPVEPITLAECRAHLNLVPDVDSDDVETHPDDELVLALLGAAREHAESFTGCTIARRQVEQAFDTFPEDGEPLELAAYPAIELVDLVYTHQGETSSSSSSDADLNLTLDDYAFPARLVLNGSGRTWPALEAIPNAVRVRLEVGYLGPEASSDDAGETLPKQLRAAILLLLGHLYENREATVEKSLAEIPFGVETLLRSYRYRLGMA
jgi:uncharacterized phiE125 gp8 family phage protein